MAVAQRRIAAVALLTMVALAATCVAASTTRGIKHVRRSPSEASKMAGQQQQRASFGDPATTSPAPVLPVEWVYYSPYFQSGAATAVLASTVDPTVVFAYMATSDASVFAIVALDSDHGKLIWNATVTNASSLSSAAVLLETSTAVICISASGAVSVDRGSGAVIGSGVAQLPDGLAIASNFEGDNHVVQNGGTVAFLARNPNELMMEGAAFSFDASTGALTSLGTYNSTIAISAWWGLQLSSGDSGDVSWTVMLYSGFNKRVQGQPCSVIAAVTFSSSTKVSSVYTVLDPIWHGTPPDNVTYCPDTTIDVNRASGTFAAMWPSSATSVIAYNLTSGAPIANVTVEAVYPYSIFLFPANADTDSETLVLASNNHGFTAYNVRFNYRIWKYVNTAVLQGVVTYLDATSFAIGGLLDPYVTRFSVATGLNEWRTEMPEPVGQALQMYYGGDSQVMVFVATPCVTVLDVSTGAVVGVLNVEPTTYSQVLNTFDVRGPSLFLAGANTVAKVHLALNNLTRV